MATKRKCNAMNDKLVGDSWICTKATWENRNVMKIVIVAGEIIKALKDEVKK